MSLGGLSWLLLLAVCCLAVPPPPPTVFYTYHTDPVCSSPIYETRIAQYLDNMGNKQNLQQGVCVPFQNGSFVTFGCRLNGGGKMYSLSFKPFAATDSTCVTPLSTRSSIYEHESICAPDDKRGVGFVKIHCGTTAADVALLANFTGAPPAYVPTQESVRADALYADPRCRIGPTTSQTTFLNTCQPAADNFKGPHGGRLLFYFIVTPLSYAPPVSLRLRKFGSQDVNCTRALLGQRHHLYPAPAAAAASQTCLPDPLNHGLYYLNAPGQAPYIYTAPSRAPTGQPTGQPSVQPSRQPSRQPTAQPTGHPTRPSPAPSPVPTAPTPAPSPLSIIARYVRWSQTGGSTANPSNHFVELQVLTFSSVNRALNLGQSGAVTKYSGSATIWEGNFQQTTDGNTDSSFGTYLDYGSGDVGIQYDLGALYGDIAQIKFWNYYLDGRTYYGSKIEVSRDGSTWKVLYGPQNTATPSTGVVVNPVAH